MCEYIGCVGCCDHCRAVNWALDKCTTCHVKESIETARLQHTILDRRVTNSDDKRLTEQTIDLARCNCGHSSHS